MFGLVLGAFFGGTLAGCGGGQARSPRTSQVAGEAHSVLDPACEKNPLDGVHGPDRLRLLDPCAVFQGTVIQAPKESPDDGDVTFTVAADPGYASMLNAQNLLNGGLHIEIVPRDQPGCTPGQPVHVGDVSDLGICSGRAISAPTVGAHVRIIGPWVLDRNNDWNEIHPTWSITAPGCRVPRLVGRTLRRARAAIASSGCSVGEVSHRTSRKRLTGHVLAQRPRSGAVLPERTRVNVTVGRGRRRS